MAQKRTTYKNDYIRNNYERINLFTAKGIKDSIRKTAESKGESVNAYINKAIREALKRDGVSIEEETTEEEAE